MTIESIKGKDTETLKGLASALWENRALLELEMIAGELGRRGVRIKTALAFEVIA